MLVTIISLKHLISSKITSSLHICKFVRPLMLFPITADSNNDNAPVIQQSNAFKTCSGNRYEKKHFVLNLFMCIGFQSRLWSNIITVTQSVLQQIYYCIIRPSVSNSLVCICTQILKADRLHARYFKLRLCLQFKNMPQKLLSIYLIAISRFNI